MRRPSLTTSAGRAVSAVMNRQLLFRKLWIAPLFAVITSAAAQSPAEHLAEYLMHPRHDFGHYLAAIEKDQEPEALSYIRPFLNDSSAERRQRAWSLFLALAAGSENPHIRQEGPTALLDMLGDPPDRHQQFFAEITRFRSGDFTDALRDSVRVRINAKDRDLDRWMRVAGFLQLADLRETMHRQTLPGNPSHIRWAALLGRARLGDTSAATEILERVGRLPVNDDVVYAVFPDLVYTRHPQCIAFLVGALQHDAKNCLPANPADNTPIPCAYRILELLAPVIEGFPVAVDVHGDVVDTDYRTALATARAWLAARPQYKLITDTW